MHVTIADAEVAIEAACKRALELGTEMCIAIVDSGANLKAFHRMDGRQHRYCYQESEDGGLLWHADRANR